MSYLLVQRNVISFFCGLQTQHAGIEVRLLVVCWHDGKKINLSNLYQKQFNKNGKKKLFL